MYIYIHVYMYIHIYIMGARGALKNTHSLIYSFWRQKIANIFINIEDVLRKITIK